MTKAKGFLTGAVVGSVLGAITALLFAQKPGKELRSDIAEQAKAVGEKTEDIATAVKTHATEWVEKVKDIGLVATEEVRSWKQCRNETPVEEAATVSQVEDIATSEDEELSDAEKI
ncbi:MAG: YtxH domain-containing protein [Gorillibacterium sp.]|nr:YtxH domain-containing protein [Gorillibacterium sp.]